MLLYMIGEIDGKAKMSMYKKISGTLWMKTIDKTLDGQITMTAF